MGWSLGRVPLYCVVNQPLVSVNAAVFSVFRQCKGHYPWIKCFPGYLLYSYSLVIYLSLLWMTLTNSLEQVWKLVFTRWITSTSFYNPILPNTIGLSGICILWAATRLTTCILLIHSVLSQHERGKNFLFWWSGSLRVEWERRVARQTRQGQWTL